MILEKGKKYRLKNGWKMEVTEQEDVDRFSSRVTYERDEKEIFYSDGVSYHRDGKRRGYADEDHNLHVVSEWSERDPGRKGYDGWDLDDWRRAIENTKMFG